MRTMMIALLAALSAPAAALAGDLRVVITGVPNGHGSVLGGLYTSEATFMHAPQAKALCKVKAAAGQVTCVFRNVAPGRYAVAVFHDANDNGVLDRNGLGVPTEGYGFSNNAQGFGGPPAFGQAVFSVAGPSPSITIALDN